MITIVDYGLGNIRAFANVYKRLNLPFSIASSAEDLRKADRIILPGVGAFDEAMQLLGKSGMRPALEDQVLGRKVPVLGICVGMQMLARGSEEGKLPGLGWINGTVKRFDASTLAHRTRLPHMGWNRVEPRASGGLFEGMDEGSRFYFLHSYYFRCDDEADALAVTDYGGPFHCAVGSSNVIGVQFHPEKSHGNGVRLLRNFGAA